MFQAIIDSYDEEPLRAKKSLPAPAVDPLLASAYEVAEKSPIYIDQEVLSYIYNNEQTINARTDAQAFREVMNYISDAENVYSKVHTTYSHLLPDGHPRRPDPQSREDLADYLSTQAPEHIQDALIASISAEPGSIEREFNSYAVRDSHVDYSYLVDLADSLVAASEPAPTPKEDSVLDDIEDPFVPYITQDDFDESLLDESGPDAYGFYHAMAEDQAYDTTPEEEDDE